MSHGNAGKGRAPGCRNKRTVAMMELAGEGESPVEFSLKVMRDEGMDPALRINAARIAAAYVHPKPQPAPRFISFAIPEKLDGTSDLLAAHAAMLKAIASGDVSLEEARELSAILETHRRLVETVDLEARIAKLEQERAKP